MQKNQQQKRHAAALIVVIKIGSTMMTFDHMQPTDWEAVKEIYQEGIATGNATFQLSLSTCN